MKNGNGHNQIYFSEVKFKVLKYIKNFIKQYGYSPTCKEIAKAHGYEFNLDTHIHAASAASAHLEEGEVEDCLFANILKLQSNTFLMDAFSYVHVAVCDM